MVDEQEKADYQVGVLVAESMRGTVLFLAAQILLWIPAIVTMEVLPVFGIVSKSHAGQASFIVWVVLEVTILLSIVWNVKKRMPSSQLFVRGDQKIVPFVFREGNLENMIWFATLIGAGFLLLVGTSGVGMKVFLTVVNGFFCIFLVIFLLVRWMATRNFRFQTLFLIALISCEILFTWK